MGNKLPILPDCETEPIGPYCLCHLFIFMFSTHGHLSSEDNTVESICSKQYKTAPKTVCKLFFWYDIFSSR